MAAAYLKPGRISLYEDVNSRGSQVTIDQNIPNLANFDLAKRASSIVVNTGTWLACNEVNYNGNCLILESGNYNDLNKQRFNDQIVSLRRIASTAELAKPSSIVFYEEPKQQGKKASFVAEAADLNKFGMNDKATSLFIQAGNWLLCQDTNYQGYCTILGPGVYNDLSAIDERLTKQISSARQIE